MLLSIENVVQQDFQSMVDFITVTDNSPLQNTLLGRARETYIAQSILPILWTYSSRG